MSSCTCITCTGPHTEVKCKVCEGVRWPTEEMRPLKICCRLDTATSCMMAGVNRMAEYTQAYTARRPRRPYAAVP